MRRIALFSDVHGNLPALDAVLADIRASGIAETLLPRRPRGLRPRSRRRGRAHPHARASPRSAATTTTAWATAAASAAATTPPTRRAQTARPVRVHRCGARRRRPRVARGAAATRSGCEGAARSCSRTAARARSTSTCCPTAPTSSSPAWRIRRTPTWCASATSTSRTTEPVGRRRADRALHQQRIGGQAQGRRPARLLGRGRIGCGG